MNLLFKYLVVKIYLTFVNINETIIENICVKIVVLKKLYKIIIVFKKMGGI